MSNWEVDFGSICKLQNGRAFKPTEWSESGTPIIRIQNLNDESKPFNFCDFDIEEKYHVKNGDLLFSWSGTPGTSFGAFFWNRGKGYLNQHIFLVDINEDDVSKDYLRHALNSQLQVIIDQSHGGVGLQHITKAKLEKIKIPLPPLEIQKQIAAVLEKADQLRKDCQQMEQELNNLAQSVFIDMFGDPVTNPKGWGTQKFVQLGELSRGKSKHRPRNDPKLLGGKYPLIQTGDIARAGDYIKTYKSTYSDFGLLQSRLWPKGTLCITIAANIADTAILNFDSCFPDSVVGFIPNDKFVLTEFVHYWLVFYQRVLVEIAPESAQKNINLRILENLDIYIPPKELQKKFVQIFSKIRNKREILNEQRSSADAYFNVLMQRAFKGELNLNPARQVA